MDVDVEMVDARKGRDDVAAAETFRDTDIVDNPTVRRQNICFLFAMFSCVVGFSVYVVGRIYMWSPEVGIFGGEVDDNDKITKISIANGKYSNSHGKGWGSNHPKGNDCPVSRTSDDEKVQEWLNTSVSISDGIMYEVVETLHHDKNSFTEGLCFVCGRLFESIGIENKSALLELDPRTGDIIEEWALDSEDFGEGLTFATGSLIQLTWKQRKGYKYDIHDLSGRPKEFSFNSTSGEGWGLTYDPIADELIESDGSNFLNFWDPRSMRLIRQTEVFRMDGRRADNINELEYFRGRVLANIWFEDVMLVIHPKTGAVEKEYDFKQLWPKPERQKAGANVLNGISVSDDPDMLYVVGKFWDRMYKIRLL